MKFVLLKKCSMATQTSVSQNNVNQCFTLNYLVDNFFENFDVPYSKLE